MDKCSFHGRLAELSIALSGLPRLAHLQPQDQATFSPPRASGSCSRDGQQPWPGKGPGTSSPAHCVGGRTASC